MFKILVALTLVYQPYSVFSQSKSTNLEFTAVYNANTNTVVLKWEHASTETGTYIVQQSPDNKTWSDFALQSISLNMQATSFKIEDKKIKPGENYYRLKFIDVTGKINISPAIMVIIPATFKNWVMYPVPVKDVLTLEYRGIESIKGVINVFIQQASGRIVYRLRSSSLNKKITIPVDNLGRGIYDIRIIVQGEIVWNQRFVK